VRSGNAADRGDIVMGWLTRLVAVLAILGVLSYDGFSMTQVHISTADAADQAALDASASWATTKDVKIAYAVAQAWAEGTGGTIPPGSFAIDADGRVHLSVRETAPTFVLHHIAPLRHFAVITSTGTGQVPS
jgi:hypothetical protein